MAETKRGRLKHRAVSSALLLILAAAAVVYAKGGDTEAAAPSGGVFWPVPATSAQLVPGLGTLFAHLHIGNEVIRCRLFEARAPISVDNFVGLALGRKPWFDEEAGRWVGRPFYDGRPLHRIEPGFLVAAGATRASGQGGPGYTFPDEIHSELRHDGPGVMGMENQGPDTNGSRFYITLARASHLDGRHTIFGRCGDLEMLQRLANAGRPPPRIERIELRRQPLLSPRARAEEPPGDPAPTGGPGSSSGSGLHQPARADPAAHPGADPDPRPAPGRHLHQVGRPAG